MARILVVGWDNRAGLSRDRDIVAGELEARGHEVDRRGLTLPGRWQRTVSILMEGRRPWDLAVFLERPVARWAARARRSVLIPNPEWLDPDEPGLPMMNQLWCKTRHALELLAGAGRCSFLGFTSRELPAHPDLPAPENRAIHIAGRATTKGTPAVIEAWTRHPEWPPLTVVAWEGRLSFPADLPPNVTVISDFLDEEAIIALQRGARFHVCPSETEGFGHTIVEGMSAGAVVVTTDAPPMNELVSPDRGVLVRSGPGIAMRSGRQYAVATGDVEAAVSTALALSSEELARRGRNARAWYEANDAAFRARLSQLVDAAL